MALDVASSEFYENRKYNLVGEGREGLSSDELVSFYEELCDRYPIISIEDGLDENDWSGWKRLTKKYRSHARRVDKSSDDVDAVLGGLYDTTASVLVRNSRRLATLEWERDRTEGSAERSTLDAAIAICRNDIREDIAHGHVSDADRAKCVEAFRKALPNCEIKVPIRYP